MTTERRQGGLDGLRGLAALCVFGVHLWIYQLPNTLQLSRDSFGELVLFETRVAFVLFFVLSGYLLYRPFARSALGGAPPQSIVAYLVRRAARIMPAYYVALAGTLLLLTTAGDVPGRRLVDAAQFPLFLLFAQNYSPDTLLRLNAATWTLAVEVAFYVLLPVIGVIGLRRWRANARAQAALLAALVAAGIGWNLLDYAVGWGPVASHSPPSFLPYFACGMLVGLLVEVRRAGGARRLSGTVTWLLTGSAVAMLALNGIWHASDPTPDGVLMEALADLPAALAFASLLAAIVLGTGAGLGWLASRPMAWFGQISYGFYLWHIPVIVWARGHGLLSGGAFLDALVALPLAATLGAASWYLVEQPLMHRAARLRRAGDGEHAAHPERAQQTQRSQARTIALANPRP